MNINNLVFFDKNGESYNFDQTSTGYWEGNEYFLPISLALFDVSNIFILENDGLGNYSYPVMEEDSKFEITWKTKDSKDTFFLFTVAREGIHSDDPLYINKQNSITINHSDFGVSGDLNLSYPLQLNVAFTPAEEKSYSRVLQVHYTTASTSTLVLQLTFYGEGEDEDERFKVWLENFGIKFNREDALLLKEYDLKEGYPDWKEINIARKNLLVNIDQVYPYVGTYKGLVNLIDLLGYKGVLKVKEYWQDQHSNSSYYEKYAMIDVTELMEVGDKSKINFVDLHGQIKKGGKFKKTEFLALAYQFTQATDDYDDDGLPLVEATTEFTVEEIFYKLKGIEKKVKEEILPINVVIRDVIGEFIYFSKFNLRNWTDTTYIEALQINDDYDVKVRFPVSGTTQLKMRDIKTLYPKLDGTSDFPAITFNSGSIKPYENDQKYDTSKIDDLMNAIEAFYDHVNDYDYKYYDQTDPIDVGDDTSPKIGCPIVLEAYITDLTLGDLDGVTFNDFVLSEATTSSTLNTIGTGTKYFSCATTQVFDVGSKVKIYVTIDPSKWMEGVVTEIAPVGYSSTTIKVNVTSSSGSTVSTGWTVTLLDTHYTIDFLKYKNAYEIEWMIYGPNNYLFAWRDTVKNVYKIPHILPYTGEYTIVANVHDMHGSVSVAHKKIEVLSEEPFLQSFIRIHDKSNYSFGNLENITIGDISHSPLYYPFASVINLNGENAPISEVYSHYLNWNTYSNYYGVGAPQNQTQIYNPSTGLYESIKNTQLEAKYRFGTGSNNGQPTIADYDTAMLKDLRFVTFGEMGYVADSLDGFYLTFENLSASSPSSYLSSIQFGGFTEVTPYSLITTPAQFVSYIEAANLPGWKEYRYQVLGNRVKATAKVQDKKNHSILKTTYTLSGTFNNDPYLPSSVDLDISSIDIQKGIVTLFQSEMIGPSGPFWTGPSGPWWPGPSGPFYEWDEYLSEFYGPSGFGPSGPTGPSGPYWVSPSGLIYYGPSGYVEGPSGPIWGGPSSWLDELNTLWPNPSGGLWPYSTNWLFPTIYSNTNVKIGDRIRIRNAAGGWAEGTILTMSDYQVEIDVDNVNSIGNFISFDLAIVKTIYTFEKPDKAISDYTVSQVQATLSGVNKELDEDLLFLTCPFSDKLNDTKTYTKANASDIDYWIDKEFVKYNNTTGEQTGFLPSSYDENSLTMNNVRATNNTILVPLFYPVFTVISNLTSNVESEWTLTKNGTEVARVKTPSYFIWKFDKEGRYQLTVVSIDARGNVSTLSAEIIVFRSMKSDSYLEYVEQQLNDRKFKMEGS